MRFFTGLLIIILLAYLSNFIFPWWGVVVVAAAVGFGLRMSGGLSFLCGFISLALLWGIHTTLINSANGGELSAKIGEVFGTSSSALWWLTILIGGLLGGFATITGTYGGMLVLGETTEGGRRRRRRRR
ncbi:MAG: hypothetical protein MK212_18860 [Saprospiraceae bacterium]|nr:hypothetical protein [Saprospiraceae bacterium]